MNNMFIVQLFNEVNPTAWWDINKYKFCLEVKRNDPDYEGAVTYIMEETNV